MIRDLFISMNTLAGHLPPFLESPSLRRRLKRAYGFANNRTRMSITSL